MKLHPALCRVLMSGMLLIAINAYAGEDQDSLDWLRVVAIASHQTDYSGVFVYQYGNHVETSRITHVVEPDSEYEKLESLDGPKREIIRYHGQVWCYINNKMEQVDSMMVRSRFPALLPAQLSALSANYQIKEAGIERVAEYNAQVILFQPRDNLRYTHKIWVHTDSGLLLKAAVLDDKSQLIEQYTFTQLKIGGDIDRSWIKNLALSTTSRVDASKSGQGVAGLSGASMPLEMSKGAATTNSGWNVGVLPAGFNKTMEIRRRMRGRHAPVTQLVFSDGLVAISAFIEPSDGDEDDVERQSNRGAMNLYNKVVDENLYTVVGEVPPHTLMQALDSIHLKK